eukprot:2346149-Lingulodinium_polyedra.AAC.1
MGCVYSGSARSSRGASRRPRRTSFCARRPLWRQRGALPSGSGVCQTGPGCPLRQPAVGWRA